MELIIFGNNLQDIVLNALETDLISASSSPKWETEGQGHFESNGVD